MKEEDYDSDASDSTVLLTSYHEAPEKNEVKRRRLSHLHDRCGHPDRHADENEAPDDANVGRTKIWKNRGARWRIGKYLASIDDSNVQNNVANDRLQITNECQQNIGTTKEDDIICIDSDDDFETENQDVNNLPGPVENSNHVAETGIVHAKVKVLKPTAINARRSTIDYFTRNDTVFNSDDLQKVDRNIKIASVINARRATTSFEENPNHFRENIETPSISMHDKVAHEKVKQTTVGNQQDMSELLNADVNVGNNSTDMHLVPPGNLLKADQTSTTSFKQNINNDTLSDVKGKKRHINNNETTEPKRSRTDTKSINQAPDKNVVNTLQAVNHETSEIQIENSSQPTCDIQSNEEIIDRMEPNVTKNKNEAKDVMKAHSAQVLEESQLDKAGNEAEASEAINKQPTSEHVTCEESLNVQKVNRVQSEQILNQTNISQSSVRDEQITCEVIDNQDAGQPPHEQRQNPLDMQGINTIQYGRQGANEQQISKTLQKRESSMIGKTESTNNSQEIVGEAVADTSEADNAVIVSATAPPVNSKTSDVNQLEPQPTHPSISLMVHSAMKELKASRGVSVQAIKKFIATQYKIDVEPLTASIKQYLRSAVESGTLQQIKVKSAAGSLDSSANSMKPAAKTLSYHFTKQKIIAVNDEKKTSKTAQTISKIQNTQNSKEGLQREQEPKQQRITSHVIDNEKHVSKVQNEKISSESQNRQATGHENDEQMVLDIHDTGNVQDVSRGKIHGENQGNQAFRNVLDEPKVCEQYDRVADTIPSEKENDRARDEHEIDINNCQQNEGEPKNTRTLPDDMSEAQDKGNVHDKDIVREAHEHDPQVTSKEEQTTRITTNKEESMITQDDTRENITQTSQFKKISESQDKEETKKVIHERKMTKANEHQTNARLSILLFQIDFFTIFKNKIKGNVRIADPEFVSFFDGVIQTLRASHTSGTAKTDLSYCCPKCSYMSVFPSSLPNNTDIEESIPDDDRSQKCAICGGIRKLYIKYWRRYVSKRVCTKNLSQLTSDPNAATDNKQPQEHNGKSDKRKSNEPTGDATNPKRIRAHTEQNKAQNGMDLTNASNVNSLDVNANLFDVQTNVQNITETTESHNRNQLYDNLSREIKESASEETQGNNEANSVINNGNIRETIRDTELNIEETDHAKTNSGPNQDCDANACENTPGKSSKDSKSKSQMKTAKLTDDVNVPNKDQSDEKASSSGIKSINEENDDGIEKDPNETSNEISKSATVRDKQDELNTDINLGDEESRLINESNINSLNDCFTKISNVMFKKKRLESAPSTVSILGRTNSIDNLTDNSTNNKADIEYICPVCSCIYVYPTSFLSHLRQHNILNPKIPDNCIRRKCKYCNVIFKCKESFNKHVKEQHSNRYTETVTNAETPSIPNEESSNSRTIKKKIPVAFNTGSNKAPALSKYKLMCSQCGEILETYYAARNHRMRKHPECRHQKIFDKVMIDSESHDQDEIDDSDHDELHETEGDGEASTQIDSTNEDEREASELDKNLDDPEESCDSDASPCNDTYVQGETSDEQIDNDKRDKIRRRKQITNTRHGDSSKSRRELEDTRCNDTRVINTPRRRTYLCLLCHETFFSDWSSRKHRKDKHPDMRRAHLFKTIKDGASTSIEQSKTDGKRLTENECSSESEEENKINKSLRKRCHRSDKSIHEARRIERRDDEHYSSGDGANDAENCTEIESNDESIPSNNQDEEIASDHEIVNASIVRKKNERVTKLFADEHETSVQNNINEDHSYSDLIARSTETGITEIEEAVSDDETIKASKKAVKKRKERLSALFGDENESFISDKICQKDGDPAAKSNQELSTLNNESSSQYVGNEDSYEKTNLNVCEENEAVGESAINESSLHTQKRNENINSLVTNENEGPIPSNIHEKHYDDTERSAETGGEIETFIGHTDITETDAAGSDDETIKASKKAVRKRNERLSALFGENNDLISVIISETDDDMNAKSKQELCTTNNDSTGQYVANDTVQKNKECITSCAQADGGTECNQPDREGYANNRRDHLLTKFEKNKEVTTKDTFENKDKDVPIERDDVGINTNKKDALSNANKTKESCCEKGVKNPNVSAIEGNIKINNYENRAKASGSDQLEIDMIDNLLEEYDRQTNGDPRESCNEKDKDSVDLTSQVSKDTAQINDDGNNKRVSDKTCLDKIQITNVKSIVDKLYIFQCKECHYATDIYDNTISHCQNHFNQIDDAVIYCNICQIKYGTSCFARHEASHDKYLGAIKVKFSHQWLFTNWHYVFENNNMPLSVAEDMQVKSIYKTFCVKMAVKEEGAWHTALFICAKCNVCVPPNEIEKHVNQKCPSMTYLCSICDRAFLTYDMREHHNFYHQDDSFKPFKVVLFNDKNDDSFNLTLFQAKSRILDNKGNVDIFKCLCGLCFGSLKKFKLHFVACEVETNNGLECPECIFSLCFSPEELDSHVSLHATGKNNFRVKKITFQIEASNDSPGGTVIESADDITDNVSDFEPHNEFVIKRDMLKEESLSQVNNILTENHSVAANATAMDLRVKRDLKDEVLSQENITEQREELFDVDRELQVKRDLLKDELLSQETAQPEQSESIADGDINRDLQIKKDLLKDELLSQDTTEPEPTVSTAGDLDTDIQVKKDLLKGESLSQDIMEGLSEMTITNTDVSKDLQARKDNEDLLSQESITVSQSENSVTDVDNATDSQSTKNVSQESNSQVVVVAESEPLIVIDTDSDSDVEYVG